MHILEKLSRVISPVRESPVHDDVACQPIFKKNIYFITFAFFLFSFSQIFDDNFVRRRIFPRDKLTISNCGLVDSTDPKSAYVSGFQPYVLKPSKVSSIDRSRRLVLV